jgi:hypothetical protein
MNVMLSRIMSLINTRTAEQPAGLKEVKALITEVHSQPISVRSCG